MGHDRDVLRRAAGKALSGKDAHAHTGSVLDGLDWRLAGERPGNAPHSAFQLANHMLYWLEWVLKWLDGKRPRPPKHAAGGWPGPVGPASRRELERTARRLRDALDGLDRRSRDADLLSARGKTTRLEMLLVIGSHTSYHAGQVVVLRQMLGCWPPPSGGVTW